MKKLSVIAQEQGKSLAELKEKGPEDTDLRVDPNGYDAVPEQGKPKNSEIDNYFFLPALGSYNDDKLIQLGSNGTYWSSSTCINSARRSRYLYAYVLTFASNEVVVFGTNRTSGYIAQPFK